MNLLFQIGAYVDPLNWQEFRSFPLCSENCTWAPNANPGGYWTELRKYKFAELTTANWSLMYSVHQITLYESGGGEYWHTFKCQHDPLSNKYCALTMCTWLILASAIEDYYLRLMTCIDNIKGAVSFIPASITVIHARLSSMEKSASAETTRQTDRRTIYYLLIKGFLSLMLTTRIPKLFFWFLPLFNMKSTLNFLREIISKRRRFRLR